MSRVFLSSSRNMLWRGRKQESFERKRGVSTRTRLCNQQIIMNQWSCTVTYTGSIKNSCSDRRNTAPIFCFHKFEICILCWNIFSCIFACVNLSLICFIVTGTSKKSLLPFFANQRINKELLEITGKGWNRADVSTWYLQSVRINNSQFQFLKVFEL